MTSEERDKLIGRALIVVSNVLTVVLAFAVIGFVVAHL